MALERRKKTILDAQAREFVVRLRDYFEREAQNGGPLVPVERVLDRVSAALDVAKRTVSRITKEKFGETGIEDNELSTPSKTRKRKASVTDIDSYDVEAIKKHIYGYCERKEYPSLSKLYTTLKEAGLYSGGSTSLRIVLLKIGFKWKKTNNKKIIKKKKEEEE